MFRIILIAIFFICLIFENSVKGNFFNYGNFIVISSYDTDNLCSGIQIKGILDTFRKYNLLPKRIIYVRFRRFNTTNTQRYKIVKKIYEKYKNVDYVMLVDDLAFRYFSEAFKSNKIIYFTGLNKPISEYKEFLNLFKWCGIEEYYDFNKLTKYLSKNYIYPAKYIILYDINTASSQEIVKLWAEILYKYKNAEIVPVESITDLKNVAQKYNNKKGYIIISVILSLRDDITNKLYSMIYTSKLVRREFNKSFLVGINPVQILYDYDMVITADFYGMGIDVAEMSYNKKCYVKKSKTFILINGKWKDKFINSENSIFYIYSEDIDGVNKK